MFAWLTWAVLGGAASAVCYGMAAPGGLLGVLLFWAAPLPVYLVALRHGATAGGLAAASGALLISFLVPAAMSSGETGGDRGSLEALAYFLAFGGVAAAAGALATLRRGPAGGFLDPGLLWIGLSLWGAVLFLGVVAFAGAGELQDRLGTMFTKILEGMIDPSANADLEAMSRRLVAVVPPTAAVFWAFMQILNLAAAQALLARRGQSLRTGGVLGRPDLPLVALAVLAALVALAFTDGDLGFVAKTLAAFAAVPYVLAGLAFAHAATRGWSLRWLVLTVLYVFLTANVLLAAPIVATLGIWDQLSNLRRRNGNDGEEE